MKIVLREWRHQGVTPQLAVAKNEIHVWHWRHDAAFAHDSDPVRLLSADERARAARFLVEKPRIEFVATRSTLRRILAAYLGATADSLSFHDSDRRKPSLDHHPEICFNVSHSEGLSALAVADSVDVGIDVEWIRPDVEAAALAERFFSAAECEDLLNLRGEALTHGFFRLWTRKEAYIKARGHGLSLALDSFDVSLEPDATTALLRTRPDPSEAQHWLVGDLRLAAGYASALAYSSSRTM